MKVLILNCGSSSIKYKMYDMDNKAVLAAGGIEKIGSQGAFLKTKQPVADKTFYDIPDHDTGVEIVLRTLTDKAKGCITSSLQLQVKIPLTQSPTILTSLQFS